MAAKSKAKRGVGQPPHKPTAASRRLVSDLSGYGFPQEEICLYVGITKPTLRKHYKDEIAKAKVLKKFNVINNAYQKATDDDPRNNNILIFWLKTQCGWKESDAAEMLELIETLRFKTLQTMPADAFQKLGDIDKEK